MSYHQQYQYYNIPPQTNQSYSIANQQSLKSLQHQPFIPQQQNPYIQNNSKNNQNINQIIPKSTSNPFTLQTNIQQQSSKGPQFLFSQEQSNDNQPIAEKLLIKQQKQQDPKIILNYKKEKDDVWQAQNNQKQNDEEELEEDDQEQYEVDNKDEEYQQEDEDDQEDDDTEKYDTEEETEYKNNNKQQADANKYKSVTEIEAMRKEVNQINQELDKLDQLIEGSLIMSRINFGDQSVQDVLVSQDSSYQQYLKEIEQFKLQKQVNPKSMKGS